MIVCFYLSFICVYLVTMATKFKKEGSNQLEMGENSFFGEFCSNSVQSRCLWWFKLANTPEWSYTTTPLEVIGANIRAGGVILHQITLMSPLSCMAGMKQITKRLSCLDQWLVLQIHLMNPSPSRPLHMVTWVGVGLHRGYYPKVMTRSSQDHREVKSAPNR